jgi:hypothetical protein
MPDCNTLKREDRGTNRGIFVDNFCLPIVDKLCCVMVFNQYMFRKVLSQSAFAQYNDVYALYCVRG